MTRQCAWCGTFLEEICPECGAPGRSLNERWLVWLIGKLLHAPVKMLYVCANWQGECSTLLFGRGCGSLVTHGICADCMEKERQRKRPIPVRNSRVQ